MGAPGVGLKNWLQVGLESSYATKVAATHRIGILGYGFKRSLGLVPDSTMTGATVNEEPDIPTLEGCDGWLETWLDVENLLLLFDLAYGTATYGSLGGSTTGAGPYTHTLDDSKDTFNSASFELGQGNIPASKCATVIGAKVSRLTISAAGDEGEGSLGKVRLEFTANRKQDNQTPTAGPTIGAHTYLGWRNLTTLTNGGADAAGDQKITGFSYTLENPLLRQWTGASGQYPDEPVLNGRRKTSFSITQRRHTRTPEDDFLAQTNLTPSVVLTSGTKSLTLTIPKARLTDDPGPDYSDMGVQFETLNFKCLNGGSYASRLVIVNGEATIATP